VKENEIQARIIAAIGSRPDVRIWRANTGAAQMANGQFVRFGIPGQADLSGITADGRRLEIEVKSATGRLRPDQIAFGTMIRKFGGIYIVARSVEEAIRRLNAAILRESIDEPDDLTLASARLPSTAIGA
jgi:hypothetical protein